MHRNCSKQENQKGPTKESGLSDLQIKSQIIDNHSGQVVLWYKIEGQLVQTSDVKWP